MPLSDIKVRQAKPRSIRYKIADTEGLYIEIMPSGSKYWRYRDRRNGKERILTLGEYPYIGLSEARQKREELKVAKARGEDIRAVVSPEKPKTFRDVAAEWYETKKGLWTSEQTRYKKTSRMEKFLFPVIGDRPIAEITPQEILQILRRIEAQGKHETAHVIHGICNQIFRFAVISGDVLHNPAADLEGALRPVVVTHYATLVTPARIKDLIVAMRAFNGMEFVRCALWFSAYTFQRPGEIRHAEWTEIDVDAREWRIPAEKMKMRRAHLVPLSTQALAILSQMRPFTETKRYVFSRDGITVMSENTIGGALKRLGFGGDVMCAHGFRGMASTMLNEQGWAPDVIERQLAHTEKNSVRAAYNHAEYLPERRKMMQHWADWLDSLRE